MLRAKITVDLPSSETNRSKGPIEWARSLFGAKIDLRSGKEELTIGAFALVEGLVQHLPRPGSTMPCRSSSIKKWSTWIPMMYPMICR